MKRLIPGLVSVIVSGAAYATGGGWFETPAKLSDTLEMLPGKSLGEIFLETTSIPEAEGDLDFSEAARNVAAQLGKEPLPKLLKLSDEWIAQARIHRDNTACNLAHDLHDAIAVAANDPEGAREYILWRLDKPEGAKAEERAESVKGPIKANWLFAAGASQFTGGDRTNCQKWFGRVVEEFPKSPRAELAMFMKARCLFSASRAENADANARKAAVAAFETLRKRYPRGRFDADALGWLGALAYDGTEYLQALEFYIAQAETPGHPETLPTAVYNCEKALAHVASEPKNEQAFTLIARHPRIAMAFTYLVLSAPEADNYDGKWDNPADVKKWRRNMLPRIAAAVAKQKDSYKSGDWQPRYLAMLVQAASAAGNHAQALQLSQIAPQELKRSDDLLFARGIALQRANKFVEAIDTFKAFLRLFPKSQMQPGVRLRLALALQDNHQAGEAILVLRDLLPPSSETASASPSSDKAATEKDDGEDSDPDKTEEAEESAASADALASRFTEGEVYPTSESDWKMQESSVYPNLSGADEDQIRQFIDTLVNFAPLAELVPLLQSAKFAEADKSDFRAILAERCLAAENFGEARGYLTNPATLKLVEILDALTKESPGNAKEKAERMMQLGDLWAQARGQLLRAPLETKTHFYVLPNAADGLTRRGNGVALRQARVEDQLDDLDELHHAARWWMRAARLVPGTPLAARARWQSLEALPKAARASEYGESRAREIKLEKVSREIYDKLRTESPNSPEAQRLAAYWSVPEAVTQKSEGESGVSGFVTYSWPNSCDDEAASHGYPFSDGDAFEALMKTSDYRPGQRTEAPGDITNQVKALRHLAATAEPGELRNKVEALAQVLRDSATGPEDAGGINCMEDLAQFLAEPGVTREAQDIYVNLRLDILHRARAALPDPGINGKDDDESVDAEIDAAQENAGFKNFADYLDFCRIALVGGAPSDVETDIKDPKDPEHPLTYISRDHAAMEQMAAEFLQKHPKSHKKEAATFVLARAIYSLSCPFIECVGLPLPGTDPTDDLAEIMQKPHSREPFKAARVMQALDEYDREFPNGRYAADVRNFRAATFWRMGEWDKALRLTLAQIGDKKHGDLQSEAAIRLANIFAELANPEHRAGVVSALCGQPGAIPFLQAYTGAAAKSRNHPLRYLQKYVSDQLKFKIPAVEKEEVARN